MTREQVFLETGLRLGGAALMGDHTHTFNQALGFVIVMAAASPEDRFDAQTINV